MLKQTDAKAIATAIGGSIITAAKAAEKSIFTEAMRLQVEDQIILDVEDENGMPIWCQDRLGGISVFASLLRGGRKISTYRCYPSMLLRSSVKVQSDSHKKDNDAAQDDSNARAHNTGLPDFMNGDTIVSWIATLWGKTIEVVGIRLENVWSLDFTKYKEDKDANTLPSPLTDAYWRGEDRRFYDFKVVEPQPQQQPQQQAEAQPGSSHS